MTAGYVEPETVTPNRYATPITIDDRSAAPDTAVGTKEPDTLGPINTRPTDKSPLTVTATLDMTVAVQTAGSPG